MTTDDFFRLMVSPCGIGREETEQLRRLVDMYPYASSFRMLYLKGLFNVNDVLRTAVLGQTAIYAPSRKQLHALLERDSVADGVPECKDEALAGSQVSIDVNKMEHETLASAVDELLAGQDFGLLGGETQEKAQNEERTEETNEGFDSELTAFIDKFNGSQRKNAGKENAAEEPGMKVVRPAANVFADKGNNDSGEEPEKTDGPAQEKEIPREFFTETLAKIYIKQGKFQQAINIFERLLLKYPEKSVYFADQIRFLKKLINNL